MKTTFAVAALVSGATALSLPRDRNSKCQASIQGKDAAATVQALMALLSDFGNTLNQFAADALQLHRISNFILPGSNWSQITQL